MVYTLYNLDDKDTNILKVYMRNIYDNSEEYLSFFLLFYVNLSIMSDHGLTQGHLCLWVPCCDHGIISSHDNFVFCGSFSWGVLLCFVEYSTECEHICDLVMELSGYLQKATTILVSSCGIFWSIIDHVMMIEGITQAR